MLIVAILILLTLLYIARELFVIAGNQVRSAEQSHRDISINTGAVNGVTKQIEHLRSDRKGI